MLPYFKKVERDNLIVVLGQTLSFDTQMAVGTITESGLGKRTPVAEYPVKGRGGQGVITHKLTPRTGKLAGALLVTVTGPQASLAVAAWKR